MAAYALTTIDNPYDPIENFSDWFNYDTDKGYNSSGLLARIAKISDSMSDEENDREVERAIDEIIKFDPLNIYMKVKAQ